MGVERQHSSHELPRSLTRGEKTIDSRRDACIRIDLRSRDLRVTNDRSENIVEVVRHGGGEKANGFGLLAVTQTSLQSQTLLFQPIATTQDTAQNDEQRSGQPRERQGSRAA